MKSDFWVSEYNFDKAIQTELSKFNKKIKIYDTTLRDGEQTVGVSLNAAEKLKIAEALSMLGVDRIEAGFPVSSEEDKQAMSMIVENVTGSEIWGFGRCNINDIKANLETGVKHMVTEILVSPQKMKAWSLDEATILKRIREAVSFAKESGLYTSFFAVDATRADERFLKTVYQTAVNDCGADEVVLVDTLGVATPEAMGYLTKLVKSWVEVPVAVHCHNDFGLSLACTLAALKEGADCAHVTINGLGEKSGNTDLAELALALSGLYQVETNIKLDKLRDVSKLVESLTKVAVSSMKPAVGDMIFTRESGLVVAQLMQFPPSVEGYDPKVVGRNREIALGKKSGKKSIEFVLEEMNLKYQDDMIDKLLDHVKKTSIAKGRSITRDEFKIILEQIA